MFLKRKFYFRNFQTYFNENRYEHINTELNDILVVRSFGYPNFFI